MLDIAYVNDTAVIRRNPKVTAINSAVEVDLTGQVCADSIGDRIFSGVGGQMDFIRGASLRRAASRSSPCPRPPRRAEPRIVSHLKPGAGVVTTRAHVHYVVTEHGVAYLFGKNLRQRATALIAIADPDHREALEREWHQLCHGGQKLGGQIRLQVRAEGLHGLVGMGLHDAGVGVEVLEEQVHQGRIEMDCPAGPGCRPAPLARARRA